MKPKSSKAKGRRLQDWIANKIEEYHGIRPDKAIMGERGCDVKHDRLPYAIECKNTERLNLWSSWEQARENCRGDSIPLLFVKRNRRECLGVAPAEWILERLEIDEWQESKADSSDTKELRTVPPRADRQREAATRDGTEEEVQDP